MHEVILDLYGRGEPADAVTVANELTKRGEIARVGGAPYLHTLIACVPTAANAGYYARIVRERAILRRLVEAGTRIVQLGYSGDGEADEIVDRAEAEVYGVTDRRVSEDYRPLSEIMPGALDEIEAIGSRGGALTGVPTGFADLDALTNGLHPGQMIVIAARPALGKAFALDAPLPTPSGWTTMGEVQAGDWLLGADGKPTRVVAATEVMEGRPCYEVEFDDGTVIVADAQHQWRTDTRAARRQRGENRTSRYWPDSSRRRLLSAWKSSLSEPDRPVTAREILAAARPEFRAIMHTAGRGVGLAPERILVKAAGAQRSYGWHAPAYASRHSLLTRMVHMAERPKNASTTAVHDPIVTTEQIAATVKVGGDLRPNHSIATALPLCLPDADLPLPPYVLGVWLGDGTSSSRRLHIRGSRDSHARGRPGSRSAEAKSRLQYALRLPRTGLTVASRTCPVCGKQFIPASSEVITCGRVCGRKAFAAGHRRRQAACARCGTFFSGQHPPDLGCAGFVESRMGLSRLSSAASECSVISTSRRGICAPRSRSVAHCWPGCSIPMAPSAGPARSSSRSPPGGSRRIFVNCYTASVTAVAGARSASAAGRPTHRLPIRSRSPPATMCSGWNASGLCTESGGRGARRRGRDSGSSRPYAQYRACQCAVSRWTIRIRCTWSAGP